MELTQKQIENKIADLTNQRDSFITQSNETLAIMIGALSVYKELLSQIMASVEKKQPPQRHRHSPHSTKIVTPIKSV